MRFSDVWDELAKMLEGAPGLEAKTLLIILWQRAPEQYNQKPFTYIATTGSRLAAGLWSRTSGYFQATYSTR
ncbi:Uncharacterised protein [Legionella cherrii]|uniref:Uncharacterized protein n=1 Tax=Legionella cherrii TaxID=28084 RepID=A0ABY6T545_9GAMM|nr:Uncharacterised protein [Legionella cherrii]